VTEAADVVAAYWAAANDRDWDAFADLLADDVVYEGPETRERVRGPVNYVRFYDLPEQRAHLVERY
jgi:hypothetical protein